ncbi:MAG: hypothetical protein WKF43_11510 [Acidimicrobiales bacterium]
MSAAAKTGLSVVAAVLVLAGGIFHYQIWDSDYRSIPDGSVPGLDVVKIGFPVNAALSVLLAILLVVFARRPIVWLAGLVFELACIVTLVLSRQASVFGWKEEGWSDDAKKVLLVEVLSAAILALLLAVDFARSSSTRDARA